MAYNSSNTMFYFIGGGLLLALVLVAFSLWGPVSGPEDISPAAGSSAYIDETSPAATPMNNGNNGNSGGSAAPAIE